MYKEMLDSPTLSEASTLINVDDTTITDDITLTNFDYKKPELKFQEEYSIKDKIQRIIPSKSTLKLILLILGWYLSSALHSNFSKKVLKQYKHPFTMTYIQFLTIVIYNGISHCVGFTNLKPISKFVIKQTLPLSIFQICGHLLNSFSLSLVSVNFLQTIKALSPLFIIGIYRIFFKEKYSKKTYTSLIPLIFGVMLVCFNKTSFNAIGFFCAFFSTFIFALQNVFTKKVLSNYKSKSEKLDKFNVLFYFSLQAFILLTPLWLKIDGYEIITKGIILEEGTEKKVLLWNIFINSIFNFCQSCFAFTLIHHVNPVTYSITGLVKRVFVISVSLIFFGDTVTFIQGVGITITFIGLFLYNKARNESNTEIIKDIPKEKFRIPKRTFSLRHLIYSNSLLPTTNKEYSSVKIQ
ncbi:TPT-domain-containing protein [Anaeromyces robustus]|uniref:TPT-domain-containing protein n=1 Tax=Anaeromyces robustus TaxID=1754192 RepID=A0A1Y1WSH3_9FUNG|nr:TPT-domain-containing protein [Anaeromyces robustus]|eukprot:ORX76490.1 TPT-domain-containing protein [Anaeromyces robustus]